MPCNLPLTNKSMTIGTKIQITDKDALMLALYDLSAAMKSFFYEETSDGILIRSEHGEVLIVKEGDQYVVKGKSQFTGEKVIAPLLSMYQSIVIQNLYIEDGYMVDRVPAQNNTVELTAWRM